MSLPKHQTAAVLPKYSTEPSDAFKLVNNHPVPRIEEDTVVVKTNFASINPLDYKIRNGSIPLIKSFPHVLGADGKFVRIRLSNHSQRQRRSSCNWNCS